MESCFVMDTSRSIMKKQPKKQRHCLTKNEAENDPAGSDPTEGPKTSTILDTYRQPLMCYINLDSFEGRR